jgi:hypothetical protein
MLPAGDTANPHAHPEQRQLVRVVRIATKTEKQAQCCLSRIIHDERQRLSYIRSNRATPTAGFKQNLAEFRGVDLAA